MKEALLPDNDIAIKLPSFEGPLDLLLYLIRRSEVDIYDIPIELVTEQYIGVLSSMKSVDIEAAGEFFVMASTLMYIKSRMLLPKKDRGCNEDKGDEDFDPRWELVQQLLEYRKFKEAAEDIQYIILSNNDLIARVIPKETVKALERPLKATDRVELWNNFNQVLRRLAERIDEGQINAEQVSVSDQMELVLLRIKKDNSFLFSELIEQSTTITTIVVTFLAVLELCRLNEISLKQDQNFSDILCQRID